MELWVRRFRWLEQFHGFPWNSMELGLRQFRWHEQFHGIPWNSMELEVRQFRWHEKFHGIPWNLRYANFIDMSSSVEFHGTLNAPISLTREVPWNSLEFHGTRKLFRLYTDEWNNKHWGCNDFWNCWLCRTYLIWPSLSGEPDFFGRNKISSGGDLSHYSSASLY